MERRYLIATLAIIATFTVFSRGFRSLQHVSLLHAQQLGAIAGEKCNSDLSAFSQWAAKSAGASASRPCGRGANAGRVEHPDRGGAGKSC